MKYLSQLSLFSLLAASIGPAALFGKGVVSPTILSLRVTSEVAPPGGVAQIKLILTDPKPIISSKMSFDFDPSVVDSILGIAVHSTAGDAIGTARYVGNSLSFDIVSPSGNLGLSIGYPILTIAVRVKATALPGSSSIFTINLSQSSFQNLTGQDYPAQVKPGGVTVGGSFSIGDVRPGGGTIQTGQTFDVTGKGLTLLTDLRLDGSDKLSYRVISDSLIQLTEGGLPFLLDGKRLSVRNKFGEIHDYYSYPRTTFASVAGATWTQGILPLMPHSIALEAVVPLSGGAANSAIALWNPHQIPQKVEIRILDAGGVTVGRTSVDVPERTSLSIEVSGIANSSTGLVAHVEALDGIGVFGLSLLNAGTQVKAVLPTVVRQGAY